MRFKQRLDEAERRFEELTAQMADPVVINDSLQYRKIAKEHSDLAEVVGAPQSASRHHPDLDEVGEIAETVQLGHLLDSFGGEFHVVAAGDLKQSRRTDRA